MSFNLKKLSKFCWLFIATVVLTAMFIFPRLPIERALDSNSLSGDAVRIPQFPSFAAPTTEVAWGETGATVLPLAAQIMTMRNPLGVTLDTEQKSYLRPLFGDLVDRVRVVYRAQLLDRWSQSDGKELHLGGVDSSAQTYCDRIYIRAAYRPRDTDRLVLLAHELTHSQQCDRAGGISKFGERYFRGYYRGGQTYQKNPLEKSARVMEEKFTRQLCNNIGCPPRSGRFYVNYKGWGIKLPVNL